MHAVESLFARCCEFFYQYLGVELQHHWNYLDVELQHHWNHDIIDVLLLNCCCGVFITISLMQNHIVLLTRTQSCSLDLHYVPDNVLPLTKILLHMYLFSYKPTLRGGLPL